MCRTFGVDLRSRQAKCLLLLQTHTASPLLATLAEDRKSALNFSDSSRFLEYLLRTLLIHHVGAFVLSYVLLPLSRTPIKRRRNVSSSVSRTSKDQSLPVPQATSRQEPPNTIRHTPQPSSFILASLRLAIFSDMAGILCLLSIRGAIQHIHKWI